MSSIRKATALPCSPGRDIFSSTADAFIYFVEITLKASEVCFHTLSDVIALQQHGAPWSLQGHFKNWRDFKSYKKSPTTSKLILFKGALLHVLDVSTVEPKATSLIQSTRPLTSVYETLKRSQTKVFGIYQ